MKKSSLVLLTFVPFFVGFLINTSLRFPVIGMVFFYVLPFVTTVFWFYLGRQYARSTWKTIPALLIGNATGSVSLLIYLWQTLLKTDQTRNMFFMNISQMFSNAAPVYLLAKAAILFESQPNYIGRASYMALNVLSFIYMAVIFLFGFLWERKKNKKINSS